MPACAGTAGACGGSLLDTSSSALSLLLRVTGWLVDWSFFVKTDPKTFKNNTLHTALEPMSHQKPTD